MLLTHLPGSLTIGDVTFKPITKAGTYKDDLKKIRSSGLKYRTIMILSKNLRGKTDLHGYSYKPTYWLFVEDKYFNQ